MAAGFDGLADIHSTVIVNVADDDTIHGLDLSPDLDTVIYTLAGVHGPEGWGRADETWAVNEELARFGLDNSFKLGDRDLALNVYRTMRRRQGASLSRVTGEIAESFGLATTVLPASNDPIRTKLRCGEWLDFQTYFVRRGHRDRVEEIRFDGIESARPAPGVLEAISAADAIIVAPSNPILSIRPVVEIPGLRAACEAIPRRIGISPLIGGSALKGPAAEVMETLGYPSGIAGVVHAYDGLLTDLVVDETDAHIRVEGPRIHSSDIRIAERPAATRLAKEILSWME